MFESINNFDNKGYVNLHKKTSKKISLQEYEHLDKSNIKEATLEPANPFDFNDYGHVVVEFKKPVWE